MEWRLDKRRLGVKVLFFDWDYWLVWEYVSINYYTKESCIFKEMHMYVCHLKSLFVYV